MRRFSGKKLDKEDKEFLLFCGVILCTSVGRAMPSLQKAPHFSQPSYACLLHACNINIQNLVDKSFCSCPFNNT